MVRLQDQKLVGKQHQDAMRAMKKDQESKVGANRSTTPLGKTAGVSSSSSGGGIIAQPRAVEPDLWRLIVGSLEAGWEPTLEAKRAMKKNWE